MRLCVERDLRPARFFSRPADGAVLKYDELPEALTDYYVAPAR